MGIHGLTGFIDNNKHLLQQHHLHDCSVVIDGNNLYHFLYYACHVHCSFGGDYDVYRKKIISTFESFKTCRIVPYLIMDGAYTVDGRKLRTSLARASARIRLVDTMANNQKGQALPTLAYETFMQTLSELGIYHATCQFEADNEIAVLANKLHCPVISNDSDFYIFDLNNGFLPLDYLDFRSLERVNSDGTTLHYLHCHKYHVEDFINSFDGLSRSVLPVFASLLGNDFINPSAFSTFYSRVKVPKIISRKFSLPPRLSKVISVLHWLNTQNDSCEFSEIKAEILEFIKPRRKVRVEKMFVSSVNGYVDVENFQGVDLFHFLAVDPDQCLLTAAEDFRSYNGAVFPDWFIKAACCGEITPSTLNCAILHRVIILTQVEDLSQASSFQCSLGLRRVLYGVLLQEDLQHQSDINRKLSAYSPLRESTAERPSHGGSLEMCGSLKSQNGTGELFVSDCLRSEEGSDGSDDRVGSMMLNERVLCDVRTEEGSDGSDDRVGSMMLNERVLCDVRTEERRAEVVLEEGSDGSGDRVDSMMLNERVLCDVRTEERRAEMVLEEGSDHVGKKIIAEFEKTHDANAGESDCVATDEVDCLATNEVDCLATNEVDCVATNEVDCVATDEVDCVATNEVDCVATNEVDCVATNEVDCGTEDCDTEVVVEDLQVEDVHKREKQFCVEEYTRVKKNLLKTLVEPLYCVGAVSVPSLVDLPNMALADRKSVLAAAMGVDLGFMAKFSEDLQLFAGCLVMWTRNVSPKITHLHLDTVIVGVMLLQVFKSLEERKNEMKAVENSIGERKEKCNDNVKREHELKEGKGDKLSKRKCERDDIRKGEKIQEKTYSSELPEINCELNKMQVPDKTEVQIEENMIKTDQNCKQETEPTDIGLSDVCASDISVARLCSQVSFLHLDSTRQNLHKYHAKSPVFNNKNHYIAGVSHAFAQLQACMVDAINLNKLLQFPFPTIRPADLINGTFLYNFYTDFSARSNPDLFLTLMFDRSPDIISTFKLFRDVIVNYVGGGCFDTTSSLSKKTRKRKPKGEKHRAQDGTSNETSNDKETVVNVVAGFDVANLFSVLSMDDS